MDKAEYETKDGLPVRLPFDFKIKALKKQLTKGGMSKSEINKTVALYKHKVYTRVEEVREKMMKELENGIHASN